MPSVRAGRRVNSGKPTSRRGSTTSRRGNRSPPRWRRRAVAPTAPSGDEAIEQLKQLAELKESGVLTQAEFDAQKQKLLQGM